MRLFSKPDKSPKKPSSDPDTFPPPASSRSSHKKSSSSSSAKPSDRPEQGSPRSSRSSRFPKAGHGSSRHTLDPDTHPLNLPPDQLQKRLSALSAMSDAADLEPEGQNSMPGTFETPKVNGAKEKEMENGPVPPPHKSNPTSPVEESPAATRDQAEDFKIAGNKYYKAKDFKRAIEEYTKAVDAHPSSSTYLNNRAAAYLLAGDYQKALDDSIRADELKPDNPKILPRLARIYTSVGRPQEALDTLARLDPSISTKDHAPAKAMLHHIQVAEDALKTGTTGSMAIHALDQAEKLLGVGAARPRKWQLLRGEAYLKMGNVNALGDAQNVAMSLLRSNSKDPEALVLRGRALYSQGDNDKAIQHFRQAINCDPDYRDAVKYLRLVQKLEKMKAEGNKEYKAGHWQAAVDKYTEALEVDPTNKGTNSKLLQNRALCHVQLKEYKDAISDCERAITLDPSYTKAKKTKASALGQSGKWEDAVRELKELQEQDPSDAGIAKQVRNAELELKKSKRKDYYKILGVEKDADENQIKKAYRKAAIIHHPDKNPDDEDAAERFKDIGEAYETLSDPQKRARYDSGDDLVDPMEGFGGGFPGASAGGASMNIDPEILMQMFGAQMGGGGMGGGMGGGGRGGGGFHGFSGGGMPGGRQRGAPQGFPGGFQF